MFRRMWMVAILAALATHAVWAQQAPRQSKCDWEEINFEFNSNQVIDGSPSLMRLADLLSKHPGYKALVEGNTDNLGSGTYNQKLGQMRADSVADFLTGKGANRGQITATSRGKTNPEATGYKNHYSQTDEARWMNRRVVITVTDERGAVVSDACSAEPPPPPAPPTPAPAVPDCCSDLKRELGDLTSLLRQLLQKQQTLQDEIDKLEKGAEARAKNTQDKIDALPKPLNESQVGNVVDTHLARFRDPRFSILGINIGADDHRDITFTGRARFFAPFKEHFAVQAQGEYLYFRNQREAQFDLGLVDRMGPFQAGIFGSFKHVALRDPSSFGRGSGNLGQAALTLDYIFKLGRVGIFGTKAFLDGDVINRRNASFTSGFNPDGTQIVSLAPNIFLETYLKVVDQVGVSATLGFIGRSYIEANAGYLRSYAHADRPGGSLRFVVPVAKRLAVTVEGDLNATLLGRGNAGRAMVGLLFGDFQKPREFAASKYPVAADIPRIRYEVLTRSVHVGASPPIADAGPDQIGVAAGGITLNGSNSHDPNGEALTFRWVQETGPSVSISGATQPIANFTAVAGQAYQFRLTVTNTDGLSAAARVRVTAREELKVQILFFNAAPLTIRVGQAATLSYRILNADSADITPGIGTVNPSNGQMSVSPTETTTYKLHAKNANSEDNATVTVTVEKPLPQILFFNASPQSISSGQATTLSYRILNADSADITPGVGTVNASTGEISVSPSDTTTYRLHAKNGNGEDNATVTVTVEKPRPQIQFFNANPLSIKAGQAATLSYRILNADSADITPGIGNVNPANGQLSVSPTETTTYKLHAKNANGEDNATVTVTVDKPLPQIQFFNANPLSIKAGQSATLSYRILNADSADITPGIGNVNPANGDISVSPTDTTTYKLHAKNANGEDNATVTVTVEKTLPQVLFCTATPMNIAQGDTATILYETTGATSVAITPGIGAVGTKGQITVTPAATTLYTVTATNSFGSASCSVTVSVTPGTAPRIVRFTAAPMTVQQGGTSTLVWQVENAKNVTITPTLGKVGLVGTQDVTINQTTTYTLTATNDFGQAQAQVTVTATPPPPATIVSFTANPPVSPSPGSPVTLTCIATNANSITIDGIGPVDVNGSVKVTPLVDTTYTCIAVGKDNKPVTATVLVKVTPPPPATIVSFTANPPISPAPGSPVILTCIATNANSVSIDGVGPVDGSGSVKVNPLVDTTYTCTAVGKDNKPVTATLLVKVTPPPPATIVSFTANPPVSPSPGSAVTLTCVATNALSVTIDGVGPVDGSGNVKVNPLVDTTYTCIAVGKDNKPVTATLLEKVTPFPPAVIVSFTANPPVSPAPGAPVTLTCTATNAISVAINGLGALDASGSVKVNPLVDTTYTCTALGKDNKPATATLLVKVTPTPVPPVVVIVSGNGNCVNNGAALTICETVVRELSLDLSGSKSPVGNNPLTFFVTSRQTSAVVLNPTSPTPMVELSELFGDYFFDVTVTDSQGNKSVVTLDVRLVVTRR